MPVPLKRKALADTIRKLAARERRPDVAAELQQRADLVEAVGGVAGDDDDNATEKARPRRR
jgi:hypothetical protein